MSRYKDAVEYCELGGLLCSLVIAIDRAIDQFRDRQPKISVPLLVCVGAFAVATVIFKYLDKKHSGPDDKVGDQ